MRFSVIGWAATVGLGIGLLFLHIHPGNLDIIRFSAAFTLMFFGVRELWRISKNQKTSAHS